MSGRRRAAGRPSLITTPKPGLARKRARGNSPPALAVAGALVLLAVLAMVLFGT